VRTALGVLSSLPGKRIGIELSRVPAFLTEGLRSARPDMEFVDLDAVIRPLRRAKDPDEIAVLKRSLSAMAAGYAAALGGIEPGMTEMDAFLLVQKASAAALGDPVQIYGDFVSGPRCEKVGGPPTDRRIGKGELFLLDYSVIVDGYRGDTANTFVVGGGKPSQRQQELFEACTAALAAGEAALKPGVSAREVYEAVRARFAAEQLADRFTTHAGHGVGLLHPEPPYFVPESTDILVEGDIVTLEPGQYHAGVAGMRYERNYRITREGYEVLSQHQITIERTS
jgi:Xaa-Pro aminopeptidase